MQQHIFGLEENITGGPQQFSGMQKQHMGLRTGIRSKYETVIQSRTQFSFIVQHISGAIGVLTSYLDSYTRAYMRAC